MKTRTLGSQGLVVSSIGLGTMGMSGVAGMQDMYGPADEAEGIATIRHALDLGVTFFDTAQVYGPNHNEELLGRALAGRRHEAIIATKFGFRIVDGKIAGADSSPANVRAVLEGCLQRLGTDHIDLWYQHRLDRSVPIEDTVGVMAEQVRAGKVRYLGLSEVGVETLRRAHKVHPITALQSEYSLWERNLEAPSPGGKPSVIDACRELGIGIVPYSPLGRGFLTGTVARAADLPEKDYRRGDPRYQGDNYDRNQQLVDAVRAVASRHGSTPARVALAWLLHRGPDVVPIPGTKRRTYLEDNVGAVELALDAADLATIDAAGVASGARYNERSLATIDR
jgi:aryl-alcohol dehydrogenase-like predicted oxidoreductase